MKVRGTLALLLLLVPVISGLGTTHSVSASGGVKPTPTPTPAPPPSGPPAPAILAPANGASVTVPFAASWSAVSSPNGIVAYNWELSPSPSLSPVIALNSTSGQTQDTISGLANGIYYWHVQAVDGNITQGAWSPTRSFTVTGANSGELGAPTLNPPHNGTQFHPMEVIHFDWSAVPGADSYVFDASTDPNFPVLTMVHIDNIPSTNTTYSLDMGDSSPQGTYYVRVRAVNANRIVSVPSNRVTFVLSFNAPLPPPPRLLTPANGANVKLPVAFTWTDVPNPQDSGYVLVIASDPGFSNVQYINNQITGAHWTVTSLPAGTKYWHVLSTQGDSAPNQPANTAWSATRTFVVPSTPPHVGSVQVLNPSPSNGDTEYVWLQLTGPAPAGGSVVTLTSSNPSAAQAPATYTMPEGFGFAQFQIQINAVAAQTPVRLTASLNSTSAFTDFTVQPPSLQSLTISPSRITGGAMPTLIVMLSGAAPSGGSVVSLSSSNPSVAPVPATVTVAPGDFSLSLNATTRAVTASTPVTISASLNGVTLQSQLTLTPQQPPSSLVLSPATTTGTNGTSGTVTLSAAVASDTSLFLTSSNPAIATVPPSVVVPQGSLTGGFLVNTNPGTTVTTVTITVSGAGVTKTATLTVQPFATATPTPTPAAGVSLSSISLNPSTVRSGDSSTVTLRLSAAVPSGGLIVTLRSSSSSIASVPSSVTVSAGATSATFTVRTQQISSNATVTITGTAGGVSRSATLALTPH